MSCLATVTWTDSGIARSPEEEERKLSAEAEEEREFFTKIE